MSTGMLILIGTIIFAIVLLNQKLSEVEEDKLNEEIRKMKRSKEEERLKELKELILEIDKNDSQLVTSIETPGCRDRLVVNFGYNAYYTVRTRSDALSVCDRAKKYFEEVKKERLQKQEEENKLIHERNKVLRSVLKDIGVFVDSGFTFNFDIKEAVPHDIKNNKCMINLSGNIIVTRGDHFKVMYSISQNDCYKRHFNMDIFHYDENYERYLREKISYITSAILKEHNGFRS